MNLSREEQIMLLTSLPQIVRMAENVIPSTLRTLILVYKPKDIDPEVMYQGGESTGEIIRQLSMAIDKLDLKDGSQREVKEIEIKKVKK